ncbi:hypothetical protein ACJMK2_039994 [Sinanodonta woodiana]|uniref:Uncharacterized protein n=1 Tax=Sinanodonta woodiana TaxID=1069815 RepID=A0ABD3WH11_SINWO
MQDAFLSDPKSAEKEELYQQRRIKHLIEQARLKGHKQMNWIHEAHEAMKVKYGPVLSARILSPEDCCIWSSDSDNESGAEDYETGLSRYGISVPPKGYVWTMFNQGPRRSNTTLYQP